MLLNLKQSQHRSTVAENASKVSFKLKYNMISIKNNQSSGSLLQKLYLFARSIEYGFSLKFITLVAFSAPVSSRLLMWKCHCKKGTQQYPVLCE